MLLNMNEYLITKSSYAVEMEYGASSTSPSPYHPPSEPVSYGYGYLPPQQDYSGLAYEDQVKNDLNGVSYYPESASMKNMKSSLYKTELCKRYTEFGSCRYGVKCQFAHGLLELRHVVRHPKYKTTRCKSYWGSGHCPYGSRCRFIHEETEEFGQEAVLASSYTGIMENCGNDTASQSLLQRSNSDSSALCKTSFSESDPDLLKSESTESYPDFQDAINTLMKLSISEVEDDQFGSIHSCPNQVSEKDFTLHSDQLWKSYTRATLPNEKLDWSTDSNSDSESMELLKLENSFSSMRKASSPRLRIFEKFHL